MLVEILDLDLFDSKLFRYASGFYLVKNRGQRSFAAEACRGLVVRSTTLGAFGTRRAYRVTCKRLECEMVESAQRLCGVPGGAKGLRWGGLYCRRLSYLREALNLTI